MTTVTLYWSNICILHKFEKQWLEKAKQSLLKKEIDLQISYFGIGYSRGISEALKVENSEIPDIIVSTDLEVFEDELIFGKFKNNLHQLQKTLPIKQKILNQSINRTPELLPFLVIPLVFCGNKNSIIDDQDTSFKNILNKTGVVFGGIENSGAKSVFKALWCEFGESLATKFMKNSTIEQMPIGAFVKVKKQQEALAIVPSVYAKTADPKSLFRAYPKEGAIALPSYIAACKSQPISVIEQVLTTILTEDFCNYFVNEGDLYCALDSSIDNQWVLQNEERFLYPTQNWFESISGEQFTKAYKSIFSREK